MFPRRSVAVALAWATVLILALPAFVGSYGAAPVPVGPPSLVFGGRNGAPAAAPALPRPAAASALSLGVLRTTVLENGTVVGGNYVAPFAEAVSGLVAENGSSDLYAASGYQNGIAGMDGSLGTIVRWTALPTTPVAMSLDPAGDDLLVAVDSTPANVVDVVNRSTGTIERTLEAPNQSAVTFSGIAVDANGSTIYAAANLSGAGGIQPWNGSTWAPLPAIGTVGIPQQIVVDPVTGDLFVLFRSGNLGIIDPVNGTELVSVVPGLGPDGLAYASDSGDLYVADSGEANLTAIDGTNGSIVGKVACGPDPTAVVYSAVTGDIYASGPESGNVTVIDPRDLSVVTTVAAPVDAQFAAVNASVLYVSDNAGDLARVELANDTVLDQFELAPSAAVGAAFDPANSLLYVPTENDGIQLLDGTTGALAGRVGYPAPMSTSIQPFYDPIDGAMLVENATGLVAINSTSGEVTSFAPVAGGALDGAYDPVSGAVFVVSPSGSVVELSAADLSPITSTNGGPGADDLIAVAGSLFIADSSADSVRVLNSTTLALVTTIHVPSDEPIVLCYDPTTGQIAVSSWTTGTVSFLSAASMTVVGTANLTGPQDLIVDDPAAGAFVAFGDDTTYVLSTANDSAAQQFPIAQDLNGAAYDPLADVVYAVDNEIGTAGAVAIHLTSAGLTFSPAPAEAGTPLDLSTSVVPSLGVPLDFEYLGLPPGCSTQDRADLGCTPSAAGNFTVEVNVTGPSVFGVLGSATVEVVGALEVTAFSADPEPDPVDQLTNLTVDVEGGLGALTYAYSGLPPGCLSFSVARLPCTPDVPGEYPIGVEVTDALGHEATGTTELDVESPPPPVYPVVFWADGLPAGATWTLVWNGTSLVGRGAALELNASNGSYAYTVDSPTGFVSAPSHGEVTVAGAPATVVLQFSLAKPIRWEVAFEESGLPGGSGWAVDLNGTTVRSTNGTVLFDEANGTYSFSVPGSGSYRASPSTGSVNVSGAARTIDVRFTANGTASSSIGPLETVGLTVAVAAGAALVAAVFVLRRRRDRSSERTEGPSPDAPDGAGAPSSEPEGPEKGT